MGDWPNRSENFKMLLLLQIAAKSFETCPECFPQWSLQDYLVDLSNFEFPIFNNFFSKISNSVVAYGEIKNLNYLENERS